MASSIKLASNSAFGIPGQTCTLQMAARRRSTFGAAISLGGCWRHFSYLLLFPLPSPPPQHKQNESKNNSSTNTDAGFLFCFFFAVVFEKFVAGWCLVVSLFSVLSSTFGGGGGGAGWGGSLFLL